MVKVQLEDSEFEAPRSLRINSVRSVDTKQEDESKGLDLIRPNAVTSSLLRESCRAICTDDDRNKRGNNIQDDKPKTIYSKRCKSIPDDGRGWHWLLTPAGSHYPIDTTQATNKYEICNRKRIKMTHSIKMPLRGSWQWQWLLAEDGSPSTVDTLISVRRRKRRNENELSTDTFPNSDTTKATNKYALYSRKRSKIMRSMKVPRKGSWQWLLAEDGSPSTVDTLASFRSRKGRQKNELNTNTFPNSDGNCVLLEPASKYNNTAKYDDDYCDRHNCNDRDDDYIPSDHKHSKKIHNDQVWIEMYSRLVQYKKEHGTTAVPWNFKPDQKLANWVSTQRNNCKDQERIDLLNKIGFVWKSIKNNTWEEMYSRLVQYKKEHGTTAVLWNFKPDQKLANWVQAQRRCCKDQERIDLLNKIGFVWKITQNSTPWEEMYSRLVQYKKEHGTTAVPDSYIGDPKLANWVQTQRWRCKDQERIDLLNKIGFVWKITQNSTPWEEMYSRLVQYKKEHGTTAVPCNFKPDQKLANWVQTQRRYCKDQERIDLLNKIGFGWKITQQTPWEEMYSRLVQYKKEHGTTAVPNSYIGDPKLAKWVRKQRWTCKDQERIDLLNKIGFVWKITQNSTPWEEMYSRLVQYKKEHGTTAVPDSYIGDPKLANWVQTQRWRCKDQERIDLLNKIGFGWRIMKNSPWEEMYSRLVQYKKEHGTTAVPCNFKPDQKLANWVQTQRRYCKDQERIDLLNKIGFGWKITQNSTPWEEMYSRLVQYKKEHGTTAVPDSYIGDPKLANWVQAQHRCCKDQERIDLLNKIGFGRSIMKNPPWEEMYSRLVQYKKEHGTTAVPWNFKPDQKLANWVSTQRRYCKDQERIDLLNKIGFGWKITQNSTPWEEMYSRLVQYKKEHGTTAVPCNFKPDQKLANWVQAQRRYCKDQERIDLLNKIGFGWKITQKTPWEEMYSRLVQYKKEHGTTAVPNSYIGDPKLANWVSTQRNNCKDQERIDLLNKIGFVWKITQNSTPWEEMYSCLVQYKKEHGTTAVPNSYIGDPKLANWVRNQRWRCKDQERIDLLNKIGFVWKVKSNTTTKEGLLLQSVFHITSNWTKNLPAG